MSYVIRETYVKNDSQIKIYVEYVGSINNPDFKNSSLVKWTTSQKDALKIEDKFQATLYFNVVKSKGAANSLKLVKLKSKSSSKMKPFVTVVANYYDIVIIQRALEHEHSRPIDYIEIGWGYSPLHNIGNQGWHILFLMKNHSEKEVNSIVDSWKEKLTYE